MESTIWFTDGFVVITGEIGSGKTTLIESFLKEIQTDVVVAQINQTQVSAVDFLQAVLVQFGFSPFKMKKAELIATLNNFLIEQYGAGRKVLLIVDEAQNLSLRVLEEIRMLSGVETTKEKVLRIILAGQPELNDKLDAPELVQLTQRVRLRFHLRHAVGRPRCAPTSSIASKWPAPATAQIFADGHLPGDLPLHRRRAAPRQHAVRHRDDGGVRRRPRPRVTLDDVMSAVEELQWVEFAVRAQQHAAHRGGTTWRPRICRRPHIDRRHPRRPRGPRAHGPPHEAGASRRIGRLLVATDGRTVQELPLRIGPHHRRPHHRQRSADRQPLRQPASLPDHHHARTPA